jgi:sugar O-acyltransferase (sialic acid O-acetyltransferase NeuD family)
MSRRDSTANLWIVGGGGAALQVWAVVNAIASDKYVHRGFVVIDQPNFNVGNLAVRKETEFLSNADPQSDLVVIGIGDTRIREILGNKFSQARFKSPILIHPTAVLGPHVRVGAGCVVMANAILETHINMGDHVLVNLAAIIGHEGSIGSYTNIGPQSCLAGGSTVGMRCDLGAGVTLRPRVHLGDNVIVGAGAVVVGDFSGPTMLVGVPAKPLIRPPSL